MKKQKSKVIKTKIVKSKMIGVKVTPDFARKLKLFCIDRGLSYSSIMEAGIKLLKTKNGKTE